MDCNHLAATYTHTHRNNLSELQHAACQIIPQGITIALSIRELIRQAYLFSAQILIRPLIERAGIITYLCVHPDSVSLWKSGWTYGARPDLKTMMKEMIGNDIDPKKTENDAKNVCDVHNHIVHGDPFSSYFNLIHLNNGKSAYSSGKMLDNCDLADAIAMETQCYLIVLVERMRQIFPKVDLPTMISDCFGKK